MSDTNLVEYVRILSSNVSNDNLGLADPPENIFNDVAAGKKVIGTRSFELDSSRALDDGVINFAECLREWHQNATGSTLSSEFSCFVIGLRIHRCPPWPNH